MSKGKKQLYEGMYILSSTLSGEARQKALDKIISGIVEKNGEVHKIFDQGRKKLAYPINKRREGHYFLMYFTVAPEEIKPLWKAYNLNEDLIRFMTLVTEAVPEKIEFKPLPE